MTKTKIHFQKIEVLNMFIIPNFKISSFQTPKNRLLIFIISKSHTYTFQTFTISIVWLLHSADAMTVFTPAASAEFWGSRPPMSRECRTPACTAKLMSYASRRNWYASNWFCSDESRVLPLTLRCARAPSLEVLYSRKSEAVRAGWGDLDWIGLQRPSKRAKGHWGNQRLLDASETERDWKRNWKM